jgi:lysophospholipase L1-like esterase
MPRPAHTLAATAAAILALAALRGAPDGPQPPRPAPAVVEEAAAPRPTFEAARWRGPSRSGPQRNTTPKVSAGTAADARDTAALPPAASKAAKARQPRVRTSGTPDQFLADALFRRLDEDEDGILSGREIPTALRAKIGPRAALTRDTFTALFVAHVAALREEQIAAAVPEWFARLDPDNTGRVSPAQWEAGGRDTDEFRLIDTDGDGFVSRAEAVALESRTAAPAAGAGDPLRFMPTQPATARPAAAGNAEPTGGGAAAVSEPKQSKADALFEHYAQTATGQPTRRTAANTVAAPKKPATAAPVTASTPAAPAAPPAPKPVLPKAALPENLSGNPYWMKRNAENLATLAGGRTDVLFLGDSITDGLGRGSGKPLWDALYGPLPAYNFGIGGITTSNVLWQVETGQVARAAPKVVVLLIGSNNLGAGQKPGDVYAGVERIIDTLDAQLPDTQILLLGILPRGFEADNWFRTAVPATNRLLAGLEGDRVTYRDIGSIYLSPDGTISPDLMPDGAHPSLYGYQLYTFAVWDTLTGLLPKR